MDCGVRPSITEHETTDATSTVGSVEGGGAVCVLGGRFGTAVVLLRGGVASPPATRSIIAAALSPLALPLPETRRDCCFIGFLPAMRPPNASSPRIAARLGEFGTRSVKM